MIRRMCLLGASHRIRYSALKIVTDTIMPLSILTPAIFTVFLLQSSPATANGGNCTLKSLGSFGNTVIDIVANEAASATIPVEYNCTSPTKFNNIQFCTYIQDMDNNLENANKNKVFYLKHDKSDHLAWQMKLAADQNIPLARLGASRSTAGWTHSANWSPTNQSTIATQELTLNYLDRQQQDRVGAGVYNGTYQLVTQYKFNNDTTSSCGTGIDQHDGTIISTINATATITKNCHMENFLDIDFGKRNSIDMTSKMNGKIRAYGNVGVRCTYHTPYKISIDTGTHPENGIPRMKSGSDFLPYKLYQEGCKIPWDKENVRSGNGNIVNVIDNLSVCAEIITPLVIAPTPGIYTDTVIVTATF